MPHTVIKSFHACRKNIAILKSELIQILQMMWLKCTLTSGYEKFPVCDSSLSNLFFFLVANTKLMK